MITYKGVHLLLNYVLAVFVLFHPMTMRRMVISRVLYRNSTTESIMWCPKMLYVL